MFQIITFVQQLYHQNQTYITQYSNLSVCNKPINKNTLNLQQMIQFLIHLQDDLPNTKLFSNKFNSKDQKILTNHIPNQLICIQLNIIKLLLMTKFSRTSSYRRTGHSRTTGRTHKVKNQGRIFEKQIDAIAATTTAPSLVNGILTIKGSQASVMNHLNIRIASPDAIMYQPQLPMYPPPPDLYQPPPLNMYQQPLGFPPQVQMMNMCPAPPMVVQQPYVIQANITVVGSKTSQSGTCIFALIVMLGSLLIFPLLFLCCMCTKSLTYPKYDLSVDFYRLIGAFMRRQMQCRVLKLTVVDNGFDIKKARALYQSLAGTQLTGLTFENKALHCNYLGTEADDFRGNVSCLKSLPFTSTCTWGEEIA